MHRRERCAEEFGLQASGTAGGEVTLALSGRLAVGCLDQINAGLERALGEQEPSALVLDLSGVAYLDSSGALALVLLERQAGQKGMAVRYRGMSPEAQALKAMIHPEALDKPPLIPAERHQGFIRQVGEASVKVWQDFFQLTAFVGEVLIALGKVIVNPRTVRWGDVLLYMERAGVDGLPIVGLISFLLGLIMAFMSSLQLKPFGANIYVASLVAVAMVRELGPIMTAILVAGRSGSAFAAEIGTMKVNEEVDALTVMGFDPTLFLALPKIIAAILMVPLLTLFSDLLAILGGLVVGVTGLGLTASSYWSQTMWSITAYDITTGLLKSAVFALLIAGIGCQRGFMVRGGAQAVGTATTSAVVAAMFLIIVADSAFAILLYYF